MRENRLKHRQEYSGNKRINRTIGVLAVAVMLLLSGLLVLLACNNAVRPDGQEAGIDTENPSDPIVSLEEETQQQREQQQQEQPSESLDSPLKGTRFESLPLTTMDEMPEGDDPDSFTLWLAALDSQEFCDNLALISNEKFGAPDIETYRTRSKPGATIEETAFYFKTITLLQRANDQGRMPTKVESEYIAAMQIHYFGEASPWPALTEENEETSPSSFSQLEDTISMLSSSSGGSNGLFTGPSVGTYPYYEKGGTFQKGLILVTNDPALGFVPTGHASILYDEDSNTAMSSFPQMASRNNPQEEGVQTEPNDWYSFHQTCFVLRLDTATAAEAAAVADWCYEDERNSKNYNWNLLDSGTRDSFYCSQLVWAGFLDLYGINIGNADSLLSDGLTGVHPMELKHAAETTLLYQHGTTDTGWVDIDDTDRYYVNGTGQHSVGQETIGGHHYYFNPSGVMQTGWQTVEGNTYYFDDNGIRRAGLQTIEGKRYYFGSDGVMRTGLQTIGDTQYYFGPDGVLDSSWSTIMYGSTITPRNEYLTTIVGQPLLVGGSPNADGSPGNFLIDLILDLSSDPSAVFGVNWSIAYTLNLAESDPDVATVNKYTGLLTPTADGTVIVDCWLIQGQIVQDQNIPPTNALNEPVTITIDVFPSGDLYGAQGNSQTVFMNAINEEAFTDFLVALNGDSTTGYQNYLDPLTPENDNLAFNFTMAANIGNWLNVDNFATFVAANAGNIQLFAADANGVPAGEILTQLEADNSGALFFDEASPQSHTVTLNVVTESLPPGSYVLRFTPMFTGDDDGPGPYLGVDIDFVFSI